MKKIIYFDFTSEPLMVPSQGSLKMIFSPAREMSASRFEFEYMLLVTVKSSIYVSVKYFSILCPSFIIHQSEKTCEIWNALLNSQFGSFSESKRNKCEDSLSCKVSIKVLNRTFSTSGITPVDVEMCNLTFHHMIEIGFGHSAFVNYMDRSDGKEC